MEKKQSRELIKRIMENPFDRVSFQNFTFNLLNDIEPRDNQYRGNLLWEAFREHITQYWRIGKYTDPNGDALDILIIETRNLSKLDRARTSLRNFVVKHLQTFNKDHALVAFYAKEDQGADWRFSFVKIEHEAYQNEKGKVKIRKDLTPARRYSFLVGQHENSYTAQKQLLPLLEVDYGNPSLEDIESAFGIEKVTDEFFQQYKELYLKLHEYFKQEKTIRALFAKNKLNASRFAKKLLGQIVFLYFLQKKGWLGVPENKLWGSGDKKFLSKLFEQAKQNDQNFYSDYLQYLFYEALAREHKGSDDPDYYKRFKCKVPFLNGGLFEADYDWLNNPLVIPDALFHNTQKNKAGDIGTGILDVFNRYNFTIKEDEPLEKEVAVDPEMLGKVFENMLEITERKSKGAYYTPREIVHYMCQESLVHYLDNAVNSYFKSYQEFGKKQLGFFGNKFGKGQLKFTKENQDIKIPKREIADFIKKGALFFENDSRVVRAGRETPTYSFKTPSNVRKYAPLLDKKLSEIRICDPAIGSGAFPVGLLNEIVSARELLNLHLKDYPVHKANESLDKYNKRVDKWIAENERTSYHLKRHAVSESIYGVDIDASAIDIARLRLWLSLIVDEDRYEKIEALPNLDFKIMQGNSLLGINVDLFNYKQFEKLEKNKKAFFNTTDQKEKKELQQKIDFLVTKITNGKIDFDFKIYFSEVWREKGGFDVVIGNPPYVQIQKFSGKQIQKDWEKQNYKTFAKTGDIYCLFYEKGNRILRDNGALTFITSNKWMRANYGKKMRKFLLDEVNVNQLIDFGDSQIFAGATTYTNILMFSNNTRRDIAPKVWDLSDSYNTNIPLQGRLSDHMSGTDIFNEDAFIILPKALSQIKTRIEAVGSPLKQWDISIYRGILTGLNAAFVINGKKKEELIAQDPKCAEIIKPILRGRDIKRYETNFANLWLIDTHNGYQDTPAIAIDDYPVLKEYLGQFGKNLEKRQDKGFTSFNLRNCAYHQEFDEEKLLWLEMSPSSNFTYNNKNIFVLNTAYILTGKSLKYLLSVLNSRILDCYFSLISTDVRGKTRRYIKQYVEKLPIPKISIQSQEPFLILVDYILVAKERNKKLQHTYFEQLVDGMVFELYFPEEIKAANKEILKYLGDLKPIADNMTSKEKLAVIQDEFNRLYDPSHPVRNNLETMDSIEQMRIIKEALK